MATQVATSPPLDSLDLIERRRLALDCEVDLRTLDRALAGGTVKPSSLHRIRRVLRERDLLRLLPAQSAHR